MGALSWNKSISWSRPGPGSLRGFCCSQIQPFSGPSSPLPLPPAVPHLHPFFLLHHPLLLLHHADADDFFFHHPVCYFPSRRRAIIPHCSNEGPNPSFVQSNLIYGTHADSGSIVAPPVQRPKLSKQQGGKSRRDSSAVFV